MQIRDSLNEISKPGFWVKLRKNISNLSSAEFSQGLVKVKSIYDGSANRIFGGLNRVSSK